MDTFFWNWEFATLDDLHWGSWLVSWVLWDVFNLLDNIVALEDFAKDNVSTVKVTRIMLAQETIVHNRPRTLE